MAINFNAEPYFDDYDEDKKFYRVLFRPGYAVQARELTQLQTILQNQIAKFGTHVFKEGSMVIPGQVSIDTDIGFVKLQATYGTNVVAAFLANLDGLIIVGQTSGVRALVKSVATATSTEPNTLLVKYLDSGTDTETKVFADNEVIAPETGSSSYTVQAISSSATGTGSIASIQRGVYFVKGTFCLVESQNAILDKYTNTPSYRIGLNISETLVDSDDDVSLLDNAQGSYNFAAPGADRYKIELTLGKLALSSTADDDFVELVRVSNGTIERKVERTDYSLLEETLARRTFDESGNYTITPFKIDVREHRNNDRGAWTASRSYEIGDIVTHGGVFYVARTAGTSASSGPSHTIGEGTDGAGGVTWLYDQNPLFNRGIYDALDATTPGDKDKLAIGMEPGKAYVRGYEIEKIATEYLDYDKARDYEFTENNKINATVGNFILITNITNVPDIEDFPEIDLKNEFLAAGTTIGTARVRGIEYHSGTIGSSDAVYKLQLFDVNMNENYNFNTEVKSVSETSSSFVADISPVNVQLTGSATASASTTITGTGTLFESELVVGDFIKFAGTSIQRKVTTITDNNTIVIDGSAVTVTGVVVYKLTTEMKEPDNVPLVFPFPYDYIREARDSLGNNGISYTVAERFTGTSSGSGLLTIAVSGGNDTFASEADSDNYLVVRNDTGAIIAPSTITRTVGNTQVEIQTSVNSTSMTVIAAVNKTGSGTEKIKTLTTVTSQTFTTQGRATAREISLLKADGYRLLSVKMAAGFAFGSTPASTDYTVDITNRYDFYTGQTLSYYDVAKIILKDGEPAPTAPISVAFQYFSHSGSGDYFTVNSYTSDIDYDEIPFGLGNFIDFRPRIDDTAQNFTSSGASVSLIPKRGIDIEADFSYFLPRKDKISVDVKGNFFITYGVSNLQPAEPSDPLLSMVLYKLNPLAYTLIPESVGVEYIDNKRYTMRDIGALERRVDNLEYYTSLSLLEQETKTLTILDADGLDRFKNGFFVDNFTSQAAGDPTSLDWTCSLDMEQGELRPFYTMDNVNMIELNTLDADRTSDGYQVTGDLVTLPYTHTQIVSQPYASRTENINPFAIFTFLGRTDLNPASDEWIEVNRKPDIVNDVEGNFSAIKELAEKAGVLGTSWNAWQNVWTGEKVSSGRRTFHAVDLGWYKAGNSTRSELNRLFGYRKGYGGNAVRTVVAETFAQQIGQSRTGLRTSVATRIDKQLVEDKVLSTAVIPFIRSRNLMFTAHGLKPETKFFPFFDDVDIQSYITPSTKITYTAIGGSSSDFDYDTNSGGDGSETARTIGGSVETALNKGDVIFVETRSSVTYTKETSPATAVCAYRTNFDGTLAVHVVNITGSFADGDVIAGSISGAKGTISGAPTVASAGDDLVSNEAGDLIGLFDIPNTGAVRFRTGTREFKLIDDSTNIITASTSRSQAQYRAQGTLETRQSTFNAVRNGELVTQQVSQNRTITETTRRVISDTGWYDPLAQSFLVEQPGGAFLTKVDLYFSSKDDSIPVQVQIREMVNGFPGKNILPFSRIYKPASEINLSSNTVTVNGESFFAPDTATTFTFPSPVYVEEGKEYCICLVSDSNNYNVWISQLGDQSAGSTRFISEQPYAGVLFKSQNASTWTADQMQDLKFTLYRAVFDTSSIGEVEFVNDKVTLTTLDNDPIQTANGSGKIRVLHRAHGMTTGDSVTLSGAVDTNGILAATLNATHTIVGVEVDSYTINTSGTATSSGFDGGASIKATRNIAYQIVQPVVEYQNFSETTLDTELKTITGTSVNGSETAYVQSSYFGIVPNDNNYLDYNALVASQINETNNFSGDKSLYMRAFLSSTNDSLSPVIDMDRMSMIAVRNQVNNPTFANINDSTLDDRAIVSSNTNVAASGFTITSADSVTQELMATASAGKYITTSGFSNAGNNDTWFITAVDSSTGTITVDRSLATESAGASVTLTLSDRFIDESAPSNSSTYSKYVTKKINLANPATFIKIRMAVDLPPAAGVDVYYRTSGVGSTVNFDNVGYTEVTPDDPIVQNDDRKFYDVEYTLENLDPFDALSLKISFTSTKAEQIGRVKDLRIIACA